MFSVLCRSDFMYALKEPNYRALTRTFEQLCHSIIRYESFKFKRAPFSEKYKEIKSGPEVIKLCQCSTQMSMELQMLIKLKC